MNFIKKYLGWLLFILTFILFLTYVLSQVDKNNDDLIKDLGYKDLNSISDSLRVNVKYKQVDSLLLLNIELQNSILTPTLRFSLFDKDSFILFNFIIKPSNRYIASYLDNGIQRVSPGVKSIILNGKEVKILSYYFPLNKNSISKINSFMIEEYR
jgi:hypothetical protein